MPRLSKSKVEALETKVNYSYRVSYISRVPQGERLRRTRRLIGSRLLVGDLHSHSTYSDGIGAVPQNWEMAQAAGFDFLFATDHGTIAQKRLCKQPGLWWGQEPGVGGHHLCLLAGRRVFRPRQDGPVRDLERALKIAPFAFFPHPAGWFPSVWYPEERIRQLAAIARPFAVEVINGANKLDRAYDEFDAAAITAWDRLLSEGHKVTALGASDAHLPQGIGCAWTGVLGGRLSLESVIKALCQGHCFASEGPVLSLKCRRQAMGDTVSAKRGARLALEFQAADSLGLHSVRLVSGGKVVREIAARDEPVVQARYALTVRSRPAYYRVEATALDDRRAFSTPIYVEPR